MKRRLVLLLRFVILLIAIGTLASMIRFPQTEGRAANLDLIRIYTDPFIIYLYIASIPFFAGLYQTFTFLEYVDKNKILSQASIKTIRNIKYCAVALTCFLAGAISYVFVMAKATNDDGAGAIAVGLITIFASFVIAIAAAIFQKHLHNAANIKLRA